MQTHTCDSHVLVTCRHVTHLIGLGYIVVITFAVLFAEPNDTLADDISVCSVQGATDAVRPEKSSFLKKKKKKEICTVYDYLTQHYEAAMQDSSSATHHPLTPLPEAVLLNMVNSWVSGSGVDTLHCRKSWWSCDQHVTIT